MNENFSIPGVGGIIEGTYQGEKAILVQKRTKCTQEGTGYLEIPAGKIKAFENIFKCLRREIKEETGLDVVEIIGEPSANEVENEEYLVVGYEPFHCSQNTKGTYPIMVQTFICKVEGNALESSNESKDIKWITLSNLEEELHENESSFYPMHISALKKYLKIMRE